MAGKAVKITVIVLCALVFLWGAMFLTDFIRCGSLKAPLFVVATENSLTCDCGSGTYYGLGYTVEMEKYIDLEGGLSVQSVEMRMFGKTISASVT